MSSKKAKVTYNKKLLINRNLYIIKKLKKVIKNIKEVENERKHCKT